MTAPEAVLFDAGGTLVTMEPGLVGDIIEPVIGERPDPDRMIKAHYHAMQSLVANRHVLDEGHETWGPWWIARYLQFAGVFPHPDAVERLAKSHGIWRAALPGALDAVRAISTLGYKVAIVSNAEGHVADDLAAAGFDGVFDVIVDSTIVGVSKPDPAIFSFALDALGVEPERTWYVGDSTLFDLEGADAAGLAEFVLVDPLGLYDYEPAVNQMGELVQLLERATAAP